MGVLGGVGDTGVGQTSGRLNYNEFSVRRIRRGYKSPSHTR